MCIIYHWSVYIHHNGQCTMDDGEEVWASLVTRASLFSGWPFLLRPTERVRPDYVPPGMEWDLLST